jgi:hypoxanthine phosphoribosyltransferase
VQQDIASVLIDRQRIAAGVRQVAQRMVADWSAAAPPNGQSLAVTIVPILTGSFIFVADLIRQLPLRMRIRLISVSSYPGPATASRGAQLQRELTNLPDQLEGAHVVLVDDILDSGHTLSAAAAAVRQRGPQSLRTCVLLRKQRPQALAFPVDYVCFDIPDEFVVGYGLDYNDYYRNLPDIVTLKPHVLHPEAEHA